MALTLADLEAYMAAKASRINADNLAARGRMIAYAALGIGAGIGAAAYGFSFLREPGRISKVEIANPTVNLDPQAAIKVTTHEPLRLETPPPIKIDPMSTVRVEQTAPFRIESARPDYVPRPELVKAPEGTPSRVISNFTIFHRYEVSDTERVVTGWNFSDSQANAPTTQYCYFARMAGGEDLEDESVKFALDGDIIRPSSRLLTAEQTRSMFSHCVWFAGTKSNPNAGLVDSSMVPVGRPSRR
jgi:hypothetical protein